MKIGFIGCGNMGGALIQGIVSKKAAKGENVYLFDKDEEKLKTMAKKTKANVCDSAKACAKAADVVFICVKPNITGIVAEEIKDVMDGKILVSIAAGVTVTSYLGVLGKNAKIVRTIPNLPAMVGAGITGIYFYNFDKPDEEIVRLFDAVGETVVVKSEKMIDEMIAVTSSSPAYFCTIIEAMADSAVKAGFTRKDALKMAESAMLGTAEYLLKKDKHPAVLRDEVCSPGGTTIEAVVAMDKAGLRNAVQEGMEACRKKAVKTEGYV